MSTSTAESSLMREPEPVDSVGRGVGLGLTLVIATALGVALSFQYAVQPFIWRYWPVEEILIGWLYVLRDCLVSALALGLALLAGTKLPARSKATRLAWIGACALAGAAGGELLVRWLDGDAAVLEAVLAQALRWAIVGLAIAAVLAFWRRERLGREALRQETVRRVRLEEQCARARVAALQSQIEPHFLFNTLGTVRHLHRTNPAPAVRLLDEFLDYLRRMLLMHERVTVSLGEELDLVASYLAVVGARMPRRPQVVIDVPGSLRRAPIPPWSVSTLVENAVKHGLGALDRSGSIRVEAEQREEFLELRVVDDGVGLSGAGSGGTGIGLSNVRDRLAAQYGPSASLRVENGATGGVRSTLRIPILAAER